MLCNPDVFLGVGSLATMRGALRENVGAVGPLADNVALSQFVGRYLPKHLRPTKEELPTVVAQSFGAKWVEVPLLMGLCVLLTRKTLDAYGLLDEACELGADDLELSWRLRWFGLEMRVALGAFVYHEGGASFATLPSAERSSRTQNSDAGLVAKMRAFYGSAPIPSSQDLFGSAIFQPALDLEQDNS